MSIGPLITKLVKAVQNKDEDKTKDISDQISKLFKSKSKSVQASSGEGSILDEFRDLYNIEQSFTTLATGNFNNIKKEYQEMYKAQADFIKEGGAYFDKFSEGSYKKAFSEMADESFKLFGTVDKIPESFKNLQSSMSSFMMLSDSTRQSLAKITAVAETAGIETGTFAEILDSATLAFGKSGQEVESLGTTIAVMGQKFGMPASELARNFRKAQSEMAYSSGKIMETFKKLQFTSRATGVSFDALTSAFGSSMDEFGGSARKAGTLNAILGKSVFNAVDLLGKTEAERVDTIVKGVKSSIGGDVNKLGKFQLLSVSKGLGLSVEDTRKLLSGKTTIDQALKAKEPKDPRERALKAMAEAATDVGSSFTDLEGILRQTRTSFANLAIDLGAQSRNTQVSMLKAVGINSPTEMVDFMGNVTAKLADAASGKAGGPDLVLAQIKGALGKPDGLSELNKKFEKDLTKGRAGDPLSSQNFIQKAFENVTGNTNRTVTTRDGTIVKSDTIMNEKAKEMVGGLFKQFNIDLDQAMQDGKQVPSPGQAEQTAAIRASTKSQNSLITALENLSKKIDSDFFGGRSAQLKAKQ